MDNDALDSVDEFERAVIAAPQWLRGLAPAAIEQRVRRRNACGGRRVLASHDSDKNIDRGSRVTPRQRAYLGNGVCFCHFYLRFEFVWFTVFARLRFDLILGEIVDNRAE